jgi:hypothetical protein
MALIMKRQLSKHHDTFDGCAGGCALLRMMRMNDDAVGGGGGEEVEEEGGRGAGLCRWGYTVFLAISSRILPKTSSFHFQSCPFRG